MTANNISFNSKEPLQASWLHFVNMHRSPNDSYMLEPGCLSTQPHHNHASSNEPRGLRQKGFTLQSPTFTHRPDSARNFMIMKKSGDSSVTTEIDLV